MNIFNAARGAWPGTGIAIYVRFEIWNVTDTQLLKPGSIGDIAGSSNTFWEQYAMTFQPQLGQNSIILKMFNNSEEGCGNGLADNLCSTFSKVFYVEVIPVPPIPTGNRNVFSCKDGKPP